MFTADSLFVTENIIHIGAAFYLAGFLFRDQLALRSLIIAGDIVYVMYFYLAPESPLWGGIFWSALFVLVNVAMLARIAADRMHVRLQPHEYRLKDRLVGLSPGQFRGLLRLGRAAEADGRIELTREGETPDMLFCVTDGAYDVDKGGQHVARAEGGFVGEVAFLLGRAASATVRLDRGARYFAWPVAPLRQHLQRDPALDAAFKAAINRDLAAKVAVAGTPGARDLGG
jgi:CRP-like cAMP-binding protein